MQESPLEWSTSDPQPEIAEFLLRVLPDLKAKCEQGQQPHPIIGFEAARRVQLVQIARMYGLPVGNKPGDLFDEGTPHPFIVNTMTVMFQQGKFNGEPVPILKDDKEVAPTAGKADNDTACDELGKMSYRALQKLAKSRGINSHGLKRPALEAALA